MAKSHYQLTLSNTIVKVKWTLKLVTFLKDWDYFGKLASTEELAMKSARWHLNVSQKNGSLLVVSSQNPVPADGIST